jgi:hypothetical protein
MVGRGSVTPKAHSNAALLLCNPNLGLVAGQVRSFFTAMLSLARLRAELPDPARNPLSLQTEDEGREIRRAHLLIEKGGVSGWVAAAL